MRPALYRLRADLRARRRAVVAIALLLGIGGGAIMAAAAGARRTDTAYPRLLEQTSAAHLVLATEFGGQGPVAADVLPDPAVEAVKSHRLYLMLNGSPQQCDQGACIVGLAEGPVSGGPVDEMKLVEGRLPDQADPSHVVLTVVGAEQLDLAVGDRFPLRGVPFGPAFEAFEARAKRQPLTMEVVGIVATPGDFPPQIGDETVQVRLTRAFYERYPEPSFGLVDVLALRIEGGREGIAPFLDRVFERWPERTVPTERVTQDDNVQRSFHLQALALWALTGVAGVTLLLIVSQAIARELHLGSADNEVLAAVGFSPRSIWFIGVARAAAIACLGTVIAIPLAIALSPLFPRGLARAAEPDPGIAIDPSVFGVGSALIIGAVLVLSLWPAYRVVTAARQQRALAAPRARPSRPSELMARAGASPALIAGTKMALESGAGRTAVPVRTTIAGVTVGVIAIAAALSFGSSLDHLIATPRLYGVSFDMAVGADSVDFAERADEVLAMAEVDAIAWGMDVAVFADGQPLSGMMLDGDDPSVLPPIVEGRAPTPADTLEAVLGAASAERLGVGIGDTFVFTVPDTRRSFEARVVGLGALPTFQDSAALSDGVWLSHAGVGRSLGGALPAPKALIDLAPGVERADAFQRMAEVLGAPVDDDLWLPQVGTPSDLVSFGNQRSLPSALAGLIGLVAVGMLGHTLLSAARRRARDLAVLKAIGFTRGQIKAAVLSQSMIIALATAAIGIPAGVVAGRWLWIAFAGDQGIIAEAVVPQWRLMAVMAGLVLAAVTIAAAAARAAARTPAAVVLRSE